MLYLLLFYPFGSLYGFVEPKRSFLFAKRKTSFRLNIYINQRRPQTDRRIVNCTRLIFCVPHSIIHIYIYISSGNASARAPFKLINCVLDSNELPFSDGGEGDKGEVTSRLCKSAAAGSQEKSLRAYIIKKAMS